MSLKQKLIVQVGPHIRGKEGADYLMRAFAFSLLFPTIAGTYFFGFGALALVLFTGLIAVAAEAVFQRLAKQPVSVSDGSAFITGVLLGLILPPGFPFWMAGLGAVFSIVIVKGLFGGFGF